MRDDRPTRAGYMFAFLPATSLGVATALLVYNGDVLLSFGMAFLTVLVQMMTVIIYPLDSEDRAELAKIMFA